MKYLLTIIFASLSYGCSALPSVEMTIKVVDENNQPIEAATAGLYFSYTSEGTHKTSNDSGLTNSDGLFTGGGESVQYFKYWAKKEGYYITFKRYRLNKITGIAGFRRWEPWNPTVEVVLKKKVNPIAMYAVKLNSDFAKHIPTLPVLDRFIGYDLFAGDWVEPHGLGTHRDFLFKQLFISSLTIKT